MELQAHMVLENFKELHLCLLLVAMVEAVVRRAMLVTYQLEHGIHFLPTALLALAEVPLRELGVEAVEAVVQHQLQEMRLVQTALLEEMVVPLVLMAEMLQQLLQQLLDQVDPVEVVVVQVD
jgi:hypothetical protein